MSGPMVMRLSRQRAGGVPMTGLVAVPHRANVLAVWR